MSDDNKEYLADGVYASFDGYQIKLTADHNTIYLDDSVLSALDRYRERLTAKVDGPADVAHFIRKWLHSRRGTGVFVENIGESTALLYQQLTDIEDKKRVLKWIRKQEDITKEEFDDLRDLLNPSPAEWPIRFHDWTADRAWPQEPT